MKSKLKIIGFMLLMLAIAGSIFGAAYWIVGFFGDIENQRALLERQKTQAKEDMIDIHGHLAENKDYTDDRLDPWGAHYRITFLSEKGMFSGIEVRTAGPDHEFMTKDDMQMLKTKFKWAAAGEAVGERTGEFGKGFIKGLKNSKP